MQRKKTMSEIIKDRSSIENEYKWDLTPLYASDSAWEEDILELDKLISEAASFKGSLDSAGNIKKFFDASTALERKLSNLFTYASLRKSEDTRENDPQSMFSRIYAKYVQAQTELAFSDPEILALPEDVLKAVAADPLLDEYGMTNLCRCFQLMSQGLDGTSGANFRTCVALRTTIAAFVRHRRHQQVHEVGRGTQHLVGTLCDTQLTTCTVLCEMAHRQRAWRCQRGLAFRGYLLLELCQSTIHHLILLLGHHGCRQQG